MSAAAEDFRTVARGFTERVQGVGPGGWDAAAPCEGWVARDVVRHLVEWPTAFLQSGASVEIAAGPSAGDDPVGAWTAQRDGLQALLDDPDRAAQPFRDRHVGRVTLADATGRFITPDVFLHTWDLARATGQDERLDPIRCAVLLEGMLPLDRVLRSSGHYGPRTPVPDDADVQTRLLAFLGRTP
jgi:uncharacterized protein (TIGR03086 family)